MAEGGIVGFFRKDGRVIPIRASSGGRQGRASTKVPGRHGLPLARGAQVAATAASTTYQVHRSIQAHKAPAQKIQVRRGLDALGIGLSVASGVLGAVTFSGGTKSFIGGAVGGHVLDAAGIAANAASVTGKGKTKSRIRQGARQESRNFLIGNAVYAAGILGSKTNRATLVASAKKLIEFGKKALR